MPAQEKKKPSSEAKKPEKKERTPEEEISRLESSRKKTLGWGIVLTAVGYFLFMLSIVFFGGVETFFITACNHPEIGLGDPRELLFKFSIWGNVFQVSNLILIGGIVLLVFALAVIPAKLKVKKLELGQRESQSADKH